MFAFPKQNNLETKLIEMQLHLLTQATAVMVTELEMKLSPLFMLTCSVADLWCDNQRERTSS